MSEHPLIRITEVVQTYQVHATVMQNDAVILYYYDIESTSNNSEIEDFVETHLHKLFVVLRLHVLRMLGVLIEDIGRRLPLQLRCTYQGQKGDFSQSVRGNCKSRL